MAIEQGSVAQRREFIDKLREGAERHLVAMAGTEHGKQLAAGVVMAFEAANRRDPKVGQCTADSVSIALATTIQTDLKPGGPMPDCYLIPRMQSYRDERGQEIKRQELQWMISWRGFVTLARRAGFRLRVASVHVGDTLAHADGVLDLLEPRTPRLVMGDGERTYETLHGVVVVAYRIEDDRVTGWEWVPRATIESRRMVSAAYARGQRRGASHHDTASPWFKWPIEMAMKTAIRYALSRALVPLDADMGMAIARDDSDDRIIDVDFGEPTGATARLAKVIADKLPSVVHQEGADPANWDERDEEAEPSRRDEANREQQERGDDEWMP
jgi:recombinational DNA repair protein RecT